MGEGPHSDALERLSGQLPAEIDLPERPASALRPSRQLPGSVMA